MSFIQYIKDTRGELHHVAWPTRVQTVIFTVLVILLSVFVALYLGIFDYLFTTGLGKAVEFVPQESGLEVQNVELAPSIEAAPTETTPAETAPQQ